VGSLNGFWVESSKLFVAIGVPTQLSLLSAPLCFGGSIRPASGFGCEFGKDLTIQSVSLSPVWPWKLGGLGKEKLSTGENGRTNTGVDALGSGSGISGTS